MNSNQPTTQINKIFTNSTTRNQLEIISPEATEQKVMKFVSSNNNKHLHRIHTKSVLGKRQSVEVIREEPDPSI